MAKRTRVGFLKAKVVIENAAVSEKCANTFSLACCKALESDGLEIIAGACFNLCSSRNLSFKKKEI